MLWERYLSTSRILHRQRSKAKNYIQSMMILAMAMGHTVGRPVMGMGGGTINPMERLCQLPSDFPFREKSELNKSALDNTVRILSYSIIFYYLEEKYESKENCM